MRKECAWMYRGKGGFLYRDKHRGIAISLLASMFHVPPKATRVKFVFSNKPLLQSHEGTLELTSNFMFDAVRALYLLHYECMIARKLNTSTLYLQLLYED